MENGQDCLSMEVVNNERGDSKNHNDIVMRRMKNRERQRRYRARKRLEEDLKKSSMPSSIIEQSIIVHQRSTSPTLPVVEPEPQSNVVVSNYSARVLCRRNWKKDARRAHSCKDLQVYPNDNLVTAPVLSSNSQISELSSQRVSRPDMSHGVVSHATTPTMQRTGSGRRDWKAEARRKQN
ncbi:hypothetical protein CsatB_004527 [Cannabis sativa]|uniref:uncharacterized protein LOC115717367 n=1 Tax=Cannabis sativa TaxID=3483 RepID=UPI0029C9CCAC|nr:uncharacterized protein LOC115717367 [Cannabis sativa]